ncbi:recombination mediator RecR [Deferrisoma camini]|uniref:recombination mediator RecR n=1 Tax=Deferrisoma camini TaxID=1035120 RepID=UPI00046C9626|nr:recombination mediator RecR [Deferrisoma camini]
MLASPIQKVMRELQRLPGVGEKTATRFVLHLLKAPRTEVESLARALVELKEKVKPCSVCFQLTESDPCAVCASPRRDRSVVCVVEDQAGVLAIERTRTFFGLYHVLGGHLSPMEGVGPEDLRIRELVDRIGRGEIREVIVATNPHVEGEATALYLKKLLEPLGVRVTRIARGVPLGGDLEYIDALTLGRALEGRSSF